MINIHNCWHLGGKHTLKQNNIDLDVNDFEIQNNDII